MYHYFLLILAATDPKLSASSTTIPAVSTAETTLNQPTSTSGLLMPPRTASLPTSAVVPQRVVMTTSPPVKSITVPTTAVASTVLAHATTTCTTLKTVAMATKAEPTVGTSEQGKPVVRVAPMQLEHKQGEWHRPRSVHEGISCLNMKVNKTFKFRCVKILRISFIS